jgi:hypothetical protein
LGLGIASALAARLVGCTLLVTEPPQHCQLSYVLRSHHLSTAQARLVGAFNLSNDELYRREQGRQQLHKLPHPKLHHLKFAKELGPRHMPLQPHELRVLRRYP